MAPVPAGARAAPDAPADDGAADRFRTTDLASLAPGVGGGTVEWLVTDGLGGYATGTVTGLRTRRYHALLTVAGPADAVRRTGLAALDLTLTLPSGARVQLC